MRYILLFLFLVFFSETVLPQTENIIRFYDIEWKESVSNPETGQIMLNYEDAAFYHKERFVPYYVRMIELPEKFSGKGIKIDFQVLKEKKLSEDKKKEVRALSEKTEIGDRYQYEFSVLRSRGKNYLEFSILPVRENADVSGSYMKLLSFGININDSVPKNNRAEDKQKQYASESVLSSGTWYKVPVPETGVYKLSYEQLSEIGIESPENLRIFGNATGLLSMKYDGSYRPDDLTENKILHSGNAVYFFAQGPDRWEYDSGSRFFKHQRHFYSDNAYYFITDDIDTGFDNQIRPAEIPEGDIETDVSSFTDYFVHNKDIINIANSGRVFYGESFEFEPEQNFTFDTKNLIPASAGTAKIAAAAYMPNSGTAVFSVNGTELSAYFNSPGSYDFGRRVMRTIEFECISENTINVDISFTEQAGFKAWLDYIQINAERELRYEGEQLFFRTKEEYNNSNLVRFQLENADENLLVWDLGKKEHPEKINGQLNGSRLSFVSDNLILNEFVAFKLSDAKSINTGNVRTIPNQNLHSLSGNAEMIIISHPDFLEYAQEIADLHSEHDNMTTHVVSSSQVYNEFSSGMPDISAYRDFTRFIYEKGNGKLKYLLLFGDGSYKNKGQPETNKNYILTFESLNSETNDTYVSDDFFGFLDEGEGVSGNGFVGLLDIGIGRIPASKQEHAEIAVSKIKSRLSPESYQDWRTQVCFIADDQNRGQFYHMNDADTLARYLNEEHPEFRTEKIYLDAYQQYSLAGGERYPDVNEAIKNRVQNGALIINYTGHGNERALADERIVTVSEINNWYNPNKYALWVTATCEFTPFDDYTITSAGEHVFFNPKGGAFALFTTARLAYVGPNATLTKRFYETVFTKDENNSSLTLGELSRRTKNQYMNDNTYIFILLGDPALSVGNPDYKVITEKINSTPVEQFNDTIQAFDEVSFSGRLTDLAGNTLTDFNGNIYPTILDKYRDVKTLDNDGEGAFEYKSRDNIIYRGNSSVSNGKFEFSFIVPRDIQLNVAAGKISYYAKDTQGRQAAGAFENFLIGGISEKDIRDTQGPDIKLYLNDTNFVSGGITDSEPMIYAILSDKSGINTASGAIGHDITALIDNNTQNIYSLNNSYQTEPDTYKKGTVRYFLSNIPEGKHQLSLKAWDVYNNSSESEIEFLVINGNKMQLEDLVAYPNPFSEETNIFFEHNRGNEELDITIDFFDLSGKHVNRVQQKYQSEGYRAGPFKWDGKSSTGSEIPPGMYIYRISVTSAEGHSRTSSEKLVLIK